MEVSHLIEIIFKLTKTKPGEYDGLCLNPSQIPPDDLDDVILGRMVDEAVDGSCCLFFEINFIGGVGKVELNKQKARPPLD